MIRVFGAGLLALVVLGTGCDTGSTRQNMSTTGARGQNVGQDPNSKDGPVPGSSTGKYGDIQQQPAEQAQKPVPDDSGQRPPLK